MKRALHSSPRPAAWCGPPQPVGDVAVAMPISGGTAAEILGRVRGVVAALAAADMPGVTDVVASPGRVTVAYDPWQVTDPEGLAAGSHWRRGALAI